MGDAAATTYERRLEPVSDWIKRRGPEAWHLVADDRDRLAACGTTEVDLGMDPVAWTDPDRYPPESERCSACAAIFSGAVSGPAVVGPTHQVPEAVRLIT